MSFAENEQGRKWYRCGVFCFAFLFVCLFSWGSNFKTDRAVVHSKQALLETVYFASVVSYLLTRNTKHFTSQFAMDNLAE